MDAGFRQKKYLDLDQVERDFCSARQALTMHNRKKLQKKQTSTPFPKKYLEYEVSQRGVVRGITLTETAHPGQAPS